MIAALSDFGVGSGAGRGFMLTTFLRDGSDVYRTYNTTQRGVDRLVWEHMILDLMPYGRQEDWDLRAGRRSRRTG